MIMLINIFTKYIYWLFWQGETLWFYILDKEGLRRQVISQDWTLLNVLSGHGNYFKQDASYGCHSCGYN